MKTTKAQPPQGERFVITHPYKLRKTEVINTMTSRLAEETTVTTTYGIFVCLLVFVVVNAIFMYLSQFPTFVPFPSYFIQSVLVVVKFII